MDFYSMMLAKKLNKESGGDVTVESLVVTENGNYSETGKAYSPVVVNVPQPVLKTKTITSNDTYNAADDNADGYSAVTVNVQPSLETLNATENGTYTPQGDGYSEVNVNVPLPENGYLLESASGQVVNITDAAPLYLQECSAEIIAVQEGSEDPSPTNIRPIIGQTEVVIEDCGKNLINPLAVIDSSVIYKDSGTVVTAPIFSNGVATDFIKVDKNTSYKYFPNGTAGTAGIAYYDANKNYIEGNSTNEVIANNNRITTPANCEYIRATFFIDESTELYFGLASTYTSYEPYKGKTYTIQLGDTIYGGELDVTRGKLVADKGYATLLSVGWYHNSGWNNPSAFINVNNILSGVKSVSGFATIANAITDTVNIDTPANIANTIGAVGIGIGDGTDVFLSLGESYDTVEKLQTYLTNNPIHICYELATPYTIQLTPQQIRLLEGTNNLSCNTGDLNIEYLGKGVN